MPKVRVKTKLKSKHKTKSAPAAPRRPEDIPVPDDSDDAAEGKARKLSRGQRKRHTRREKFVSKAEFVNFVQKQDEAIKHGGLADLGVLGQALQEGDSQPSREPRKNARRPGRKAEAASAEREMVQMQAVLGFQAFQKDPFGALEQHLKNSLKRQEEEEKQSSTGKAGAKSKKGLQPKDKRQKLTATKKLFVKKKTGAGAKKTLKKKHGR
eukprot:TRINITY_DN97929_c0_g1_i1.p1 TRINITY_DN97929_c0_g1~~TRINITY_DN97929_c0_g1_i1.p1  ORF type:complete len:210 (-),score=68.06 TRINITY_DN97929_c0_g1_i1:27-656(-)